MAANNLLSNTHVIFKPDCVEKTKIGSKNMRKLV